MASDLAPITFTPAPAASPSAAVTAPFPWTVSAGSNPAAATYRVDFHAGGIPVQAWTQAGTVTVPMAASVFAGLAVTSHDNTKSALAGFSDARVIPAGDAAFTAANVSVGAAVTSHDKTLVTKAVLQSLNPD